MLPEIVIVHFPSELKFCSPRSTSAAICLPLSQTSSASARSAICFDPIQIGHDLLLKPLGQFDVGAVHKIADVGIDFLDNLESGGKVRSGEIVNMAAMAAFEAESACGAQRHGIDVTRLHIIPPDMANHETAEPV